MTNCNINNNDDKKNTRTFDSGLWFLCIYVYISSDIHTFSLYLSLSVFFFTLFLSLRSSLNLTTSVQSGAAQFPSNDCKFVCILFGLFFTLILKMYLIFQRWTFFWSLHSFTLRSLSIFVWFNWSSVLTISESFLFPFHSFFVSMAMTSLTQFNWPDDTTRTHVTNVTCKPFDY